MSEFDLMVWLSDAMRREGLVWENGPNVSVGAHSSDSHYEPTRERSAPIRRGDFVLIDIWGRVDAPDSIYYDITWTAVVGREPAEHEQLIFETVRNARDAAIKAVETAFAESRPIRGFEADDAARRVSISPTARGITLPGNCTGRARTSTIWRPTTSACCCRTPAFQSSRGFICPSLACAAK